VRAARRAASRADSRSARLAARTRRAREARAAARSVLVSRSAGVSLAAARLAREPVADAGPVVAALPGRARRTCAAAVNARRACARRRRAHPAGLDRAVRRAAIPAAEVAVVTGLDPVAHDAIAADRRRAEVDRQRRDRVGDDVDGARTRRHDGSVGETIDAADERASRGARIEQDDDALTRRREHPWRLGTTHRCERGCRRRSAARERAADRELFERDVVRHVDLDPREARLDAGRASARAREGEERERHEVRARRGRASLARSVPCANAAPAHSCARNARPFATYQRQGARTDRRSRGHRPCLDSRASPAIRGRRRHGADVSQPNDTSRTSELLP